MHTLPIRRGLTIATALAGACFIAPVMAHADTPTTEEASSSTSIPSVEESSITTPSTSDTSPSSNTVPLSATESTPAPTSSQKVSLKEQPKPSSTTGSQNDTSTPTSSPATASTGTGSSASTSPKPEPFNPRTEVRCWEEPQGATVDGSVVTWPQKAIDCADLAPRCKVTYIVQKDTYSIKDEKLEAILAALDKAGVLQAPGNADSDAGLYQSHVFIQIHALTGVNCAGPKPPQKPPVLTEGAPDCVTQTVPVTTTTTDTPYSIVGDSWVAGDPTSTVEHSSRPFTDQEKTSCPTSPSTPSSPATPPTASASSPTTPVTPDKPKSTEASTSSSATVIPAQKSSSSTSISPSPTNTALAYTGADVADLGLAGLALLVIGGAATALGRRK